jgi:amino acid transporter
MNADLPRRIGVVGAGAIMVGVMIGSGIYRTPPIIAQHVLSPAWILALWTAGGALSLAGALTYAELASMYPRRAACTCSSTRGSVPPSRSSSAGRTC